jgi:ADP-ribosylation factor-like protein 2
MKFQIKKHTKFIFPNKFNSQVWVVDSCDRQRLQDCKNELKELLKADRLAGATLLVFANKQDLAGSLSSPEIQKFLELDSIETRHWGIVPCSAVTGTGLMEGMTFLVNDISKRVFCWGD